MNRMQWVFRFRDRVYVKRLHRQNKVHRRARPSRRPTLEHIWWVKLVRLPLLGYGYRFAHLEEVRPRREVRDGVGHNHKYLLSGVFNTGAVRWKGDGLTHLLNLIL